MISIVTPSFNSAKFIEDCIKSVLNQNYPNFEHIIIDGGSTDGTIEILKKYTHLKWISEPDEGQSDALNKGIRMASADWVLWLNSDDYILPSTLEIYKKAILNKPGFDVIYGNQDIVDHQKKKIKTIYHIDYKYLYTFWGVYIPPSSGTLFRKKILLEYPLDNNYDYVMDTEWFLRCGKIIRTLCINKNLSCFRFSKYNKTSQYFYQGIVLPKHKTEKLMYMERYIYPKISKYSKINKVIFSYTQKLVRIYYLFNKFLAIIKNKYQSYIL